MNTLSMKQEPSFEEKLMGGLSSNGLELELERKKTADLEQQLKDQRKAHTDEISAIKKGEGVVTDPIAHTIAVLQSFPANQALIVNQQASISELTESLEREVENNIGLGEKLDEVVAAANQLKAQRDEINDDLKNAVRQLENDKTIIKDRTDKLKVLNALNPKKTQKQNKELQAKNRELNEANARMKKQVTAAKQELTAVEKRLATVTSQKEAIDKGFAKLHADIETGKATDVLYDKGHWQICSDKHAFDKLFIVDKRNDSCRIFEAGEVAKTNPIPQSVKDECLVILANNAEAAKNLDYRGAA